MKISSQPFHSFFICLVTCAVAHSSYSLSISHALHKRMETELAQFSNLAEEASGESPLLHEHFQAHNDLGITEELGVSSKPPKKGALAKPIRNKNWKGLSSDLNPFARGRPRRPFLRSITHDITKSPFDPPFKKLPELLQFIRENRSLDPQTFSRFMIKFLDDNPKALKQILEQDDLRPHLTDRYILKESFTRLHDIFAEDAASEERIAALSRQLSKEMRSISLPEETYSDPVSVLGKKLAAYRFKSLATDREILRSNYLTRKQQYLTHLLGFMGHRNVLAPYIEAAFKEEIKSGTLVLKQEMTEQQIVEKLDVIQMELAKLTGLHRDFVSGSRVQVHYKPSTIKIDQLESELVDVFGSRNELKRALYFIEDMDFHRGFMQELKSPRSTTGHLLQFLEPESSHWYQNIPFNNPVRLSLDLIQGHSATALEIIQKRLESAAQARNVEQTIVKILKPKGLQLFLSFFKTQSPRSSHNF